MCIEVGGCFAGAENVIDLILGNLYGGGANLGGEGVVLVPSDNNIVGGEFSVAVELVAGDRGERDSIFGVGNCYDYSKPVAVLASYVDAGENQFVGFAVNHHYYYSIAQDLENVNKEMRLVLSY